MEDGNHLPSGDPSREVCPPRASLTIAMRALAAVVIFAAFLLRCHAHDDVPSASCERDTVPLQLLTVFGVSPRSALHRAIECTQTIGPSKCLAALSIWRAEKAASILKRKQTNDFNLLDDIRQFPWELYANRSQDEVERQLCEGTDKLLQYKSLKFNMIPGYEFELASNGNGTLHVDVLNGQPTGISRGMKNTFYNIVPYLLLPGLLMSAVLPFVLPALKMMTIAVGMLNNMALSGAIFTLLRNNAFNDRYDKKVMYVNHGYKNEKKHYKHHHHHHQLHHPEVYEVQNDNEENPEELQAHDTMQFHNVALPENVNVGGENDLHLIEETPVTVLSSDWINQYYGNNNNNVLMFARKKFSKTRPKNI
ncbi:unnamed protein product [Diatraea saccharalis]|uniref:Uncharacterized protein n=1 Tax=Diatraea saccharalis TaxID=40085 RepID=A0A9N9QXZ1_9NEOP|nr:unnamed protein product [Diatraea saccharalis]